MSIKKNCRIELQFIYDCDANGTADNINFTIVAGKADCDHEGYGRFLNKVESVFKQLGDKLGLDKAHEDMIVRFHQHISYTKD